jgi:DNA-binding helix-hairpin-helix protein with protein kinase domain
MNSASIPGIELSTLSLGSSLGRGGQGQVAAVNNIMLNKRWPAVLKVYSPEVKHALHVATLESIVEFPRTLAYRDGRWLHENTAWPTALVLDHGAVCGFLMRAVPPTYYFNFQTQTRGAQKRLADMAFLLNSERYVRGAGIVITDWDRLALLESVASTLSRLHSLGIIVGDFSPKNVLFSLMPSPTCFLIDCDAVHLRGSTVLEQTETPDWEAPAGEPRATPATDAYKFGLLAIRLFAQDQSSRDMAPLSAVARELGQLAQLSQQADPKLRPPPGAWVAPLLAASKTRKSRGVQWAQFRGQ